MKRNQVKFKLPVDIIKEKTKGVGRVEEYAQEQLQLIEACINDAIENEKQSCKIELDTHFEVPYMSFQIAQRNVYYLIAQTLIKAGYQPRLVFGNRNREQMVVLYIYWVNELDKQNEQYKDDFLKRITVPPKK